MAVYSVNNSNNRFTLKLTLTEGTPNVAENKTPVSFTLQLVANTAYNFSTYAIGSEVYLDGTRVHYQERTTAKQYSIDDYGTLTLASGTAYITHNSDGTKSMAFSFSIDMKAVEYTPGALSYSGTMTLTTIARATTPVLSSPSFYMGADISVSLPRAAASFTHTLRCKFGTKNILMGENLGTSHTWYVPYSLAEEIPNNPSGIGVISCETYNNGSLVGTKDAAFTALVPEDSNTKPTLSMVLSPVDNASWVTSGTYIQGKSKVKAVITGAGKLNATIKSYNLTVDKVVQSDTSNTITSALLGKAGSIPVACGVVDTRNIPSAPSSTNITVYPYAPPSILSHTMFPSIIVGRCDSSGTLSDTGTKLKIVLRKKWYSLSANENTATLTCVVKGSDYNSGTLTLSASTQATGGGASNGYVSWYDVNTILSGVTLDIAKAYTVTITVTDRYGATDTLEVKIPTSEVAFHLRKGGKGAAFGEYAEAENVVAISSQMKLKAKGNAEVDGALTVGGTASVNAITSKGATVNGNSSVTGNESVGGALSVGGNATIGGLSAAVVQQGTWTPSVNTGSLSSVAATYTRVGNLVFIFLSGYYTTGNEAVILKITGLPFVSKNSAAGNFNWTNIKFYTSADHSATLSSATIEIVDNYICITGWYGGRIWGDTLSNCIGSGTFRLSAVYQIS